MHLAPVYGVNRSKPDATSIRGATFGGVVFMRISEEDVLSAIVERAGDGYCLVADVLPSLPKLGHADRHRALRRSVNRGLVIQRRGPDGREHVAIASEGWRLLRSRAA